MSADRQALHYKEQAPEDTVCMLQGILEGLRIETEEHWIPESSVGTHSLRLTVRGTDIGTNGKGVSAEFARASAYAEFFERYQNNLFDLACLMNDNSCGFRHFEDEQIMSAFQVASIDNAFMRKFFNDMGLQDAGMLQKAAFIGNYDRMEYYYTGESDRYEVRPYYNVTRRRIDMLPFSAMTSYYGSNGMCAGNSPEEALCQGLSEILERYVQAQMMRKNLCFPDVPDAVINKYPYISSMLEKARKIEGFHIAMKDCTMGGKYPVAALVVLEKNTGRWGVKFGAHPDFGIAMERTITETTQGVDIQRYSSNSIIDFNNFLVGSDVNIFNSFKCGIAMYPYQMLTGTPDFKAVEPEDVSALSNAEILKRMISIVENDGFELLVRDVSYLGFPAYHIVIPGMSEICNIDLLRIKASNTRAYLIDYLNHPERIDGKIAKYLSGVLEYFSTSQIECSMKYILAYSRNTKDIPAESIGHGWMYLDAMCKAYLGDYKAAAGRLRQLIGTADHLKLMGYGETVGQDNYNFYNGVYYYMSAMSVMNDHEKAMTYINIMFDKSVSERIDAIFKNKSEIFTSQYISHDVNDGLHHTGCKCCAYYDVMECCRKLKEAQLKNPIKQEALGTLFGRIL